LTDLASWVDDGAEMMIPVEHPLANVATNFVRAVAPGTGKEYYRLKVSY
jgi:hypothetical protein